MVRTRDFVLFLLAVFFLLVAIAGTQWWHVWRSIPGVSSLFADTTEVADFVAEVPANEPDRSARIEELRAKVLSRLDQTTEVSPTVAVAETSTVPTTTESIGSAATTTDGEVAVNRCRGYVPLTVPWTPQTVLQETHEGVRVYYERGMPDPYASSTPENMRAIVPLRAWPATTPSCLPTDVVGIALDGSLMRNDELALYTVFAADTLVGYSLDGFPIYGAGSGAVDTCGGVMVGGSYRYVLDAKRPGLITCFAAAPARIN